MVISALLFSEDNLARRLTLCCTTHLSSTRTFSSFTDELTIDIQTNHSGTCPTFVADNKLHEAARGYNNSLARYRSQFALENDLGERCIARMWKATKCPLGCWIAGFISLHPEDVLEYSTASVDESIIAFSPTGKLQSCLRSSLHDQRCMVFILRCRTMCTGRRWWLTCIASEPRGIAFRTVELG